MAQESRSLILIAIGNTLRRDDGVAHRVLQLLGPDTAGESRSVLQLTPEMAEEIAPYRTVVFLDADAAAPELSIDDIPAAPLQPPLTHIVGPAEIVALSRTLFGFTGRALLCRLPASNLSHGEGLSPVAEAAAAQAVALLSPYVERYPS